MTPERFFVRVTISAILLILSVVLLPMMVAFKVLEAFYATARITNEAVRQTWKARGIPEFDKAWVGRGHKDDVQR